MSYSAIHWAWGQRTGGPAQKAILVVLADLADEQHSCWPSFTYISEHTEVSERSVRRHLTQLEEAQLLRKERRYGGFGKRLTDRYFLNVDGILAPRLSSVANLAGNDKIPDQESAANLAGNDQDQRFALPAKLAGNDKNPDQELAANLAGNDPVDAPLAANCGRYIETHQLGRLVGFTEDFENQTDLPDRVAGASEPSPATAGPAGVATPEPAAQPEVTAIDAQLERLVPGVGLTVAAISREVDGRVDLARIDVVQAVRDTVLRAKGGARRPAAMVAAVIVRKPDAWPLGGAVPEPVPWVPPVPAAEPRPEARRVQCGAGVHSWGPAALPEIQRAHCEFCAVPRRSVDAAFAELEAEFEATNGGEARWAG